VIVAPTRVTWTPVGNPQIFGHQYLAARAAVNVSEGVVVQHLKRARQCVVQRIHPLGERGRAVIFIVDMIP
jgi:hypothetical protein